MPRSLFLAALLASALPFACHTPATIEKTETHEYKIQPGDAAQVDSVFLKKIRPYKDSIDADLDVLLAYSAEALEKGQPESTLGNFVSDACLLAARAVYHPADQHGIDFAFLNNGGLRNSLPRGKIRKYDVYELMPFENELVILTLHGASVQKIFNFIAAKGGVPVAGLRMTIQDSKPANVLIDGAAFDSSRVYKVVTSDYLANGGDQCFFLDEAIQREYAGLKVRDVLLDNLAAMGHRDEVLRGHLDKRITVSNGK